MRVHTKPRVGVGLPSTSVSLCMLTSLICGEREREREREGEREYVCV